MKITKGVLLLLIIFLVSIEGACSDTEQYESQTGLGLSCNTMAAYGDSIYYRDMNSSNIYKIDSNGEIEKVADIRICDLDIYGDWIYYTDKDDNKYLYKMKMDASMQTKVSGSDYGGISVSKMSIVDDWIYFINDSYFKLCKMKPDGTQLTVLSDEVCIDISINSDWIYYLVQKKNDMQGYYLFRTSLNGEKTTQLTDAQSYCFDYDDTWIYYSDMQASSLCRIKYDGSEKQELIEKPCIWFKVIEDNIYYLSVDDDQGIYKTQIEGNETVKISNDAPEEFVDIWDNWLVYYYGGEPNTIRIRNSQKSNKLIEHIIDFNH